MMASSFPLDPRFFASSSGWIFGNTPPLAMVTPFSSLQEKPKSQVVSQMPAPGVPCLIQEVSPAHRHLLQAATALDSVAATKMLTELRHTTWDSSP